MAEDEIIKHTKKVYNTLKEPGTGWAHKLKETFVEILIIVFAVTVSIWLHNLSDKMHERKEETEFLTGLKKDLGGDTDNMQGSVQFYQFAVSGLNYFSNIGQGPVLNKDSINKYAEVFFGSTDLQPHTSRYEGLKASGKLSIIENKELLNDIIHLHEATLVRIETLDRYYYEKVNNEITPFIEAHVQLNKDGSIQNAGEVLKMSQMRLLMILNKNFVTNNLLQSHAEGIKECRSIIAKIDKELE